MDDGELDDFVAGARTWDDLYLRSTIHAVELYERPRQVKQVVQEFLSREPGRLQSHQPLRQAHLAERAADRVLWP
jgi:hypothetical protein